MSKKYALPTHQWLSDKFLKYLACFLEADFVEVRIRIRQCTSGTTYQKVRPFYLLDCYFFRLPMFFDILFSWWFRTWFRSRNTVGYKQYWGTYVRLGLTRIFCFTCLKIDALVNEKALGSLISVSATRLSFMANSGFWTRWHVFEPLFFRHFHFATCNAVTDCCIHYFMGSWGHRGRRNGLNLAVEVFVRKCGNVNKFHFVMIFIKMNLKRDIRVAKENQQNGKICTKLCSF